jgi:cytochrome c oxidase subunit IV
MSDAKTHDKHEHSGGMGHPVPWPILVGVWIGLMILTVVTVAVTYVDLGALNIIIAMGVATMNATLVVAFFMHLFWDKPLNSVTFLLSVAFVAVFLAFTIIDTKQYKAAVDQYKIETKPSKEEVPPPPPPDDEFVIPEGTDPDDVALYARILGIAKGGEGDAAAGKPIFTQRCATCHKLGGEGAEVGPELDSFERNKRGKLVFAIAVPSGQIRTGYENYLYKPPGAGAVMIVKISEDENTVTGRDASNKIIVIQKANLKIKNPPALKTSLMPQGLFDNLSEDEIRHLIKYIQSFPITPAPPK